MGFTNLYQPTYDLTEVLRTGTLEGTKAVSYTHLSQRSSPYVCDSFFEKISAFREVCTLIDVYKRQVSPF